jgi:hypothetical protein
MPFAAPTIQKFLTGSGTYTTPTSPVPLYIKVKMIAGGGGGAGGGTTMGQAGNGVASSFGGTLLVASPGLGGNSSGLGGVGGTTSITGGAYGTGVTGGTGGGYTNAGIALDTNTGSNGANSPFGGAGLNGPVVAVGGSAIANSGSGAAGGPSNATTNGVGAPGGGAGGYIDAFIPSPSATYAYSVGIGGTAGTAGTGGFNGGVGGSGYIEVTEYYQ